ncbi:glutamate racemase [Prolixibacter bellariivorans]|uniref:Glutamate racemase n=1 Tax=Prolixibacter bellariivorans TaxID=314319 RepID=A0A5M4AVF1_9BACT|nr:glutamate racemase [Prolixibacter bellariivorans]GET31774.1 glutamate racemase [Prolixibacter bellariivorans]
MSENYKPIGVFDSGYGGLTVLRSVIDELPQYDYLYLGDNARTPYGTRSFEVVYEYTLQAVEKLFEMGCHLVILACNTASAKALRSIQQRDLPNIDPTRRVLGVIRPSVERIPEVTRSGHVGVLGTTGTVKSESYPMEIRKISVGHPVRTYQEACPMWVPIVENNEIGTPGADYFVEKNVKQLLEKDAKIDTVILGCTHYPLLSETIRKFLPKHIQLLEQGPIVADRLADYLTRHPEIEQKCSTGGSRRFLTTESVENFETRAGMFFGESLQAEHIHL